MTMITAEKALVQTCTGDVADMSFVPHRHYLVLALRRSDVQKFRRNFVPADSLACFTVGKTVGRTQNTVGKAGIAPGHKVSAQSVWNYKRLVVAARETCSVRP